MSEFAHEPQDVAEQFDDDVLDLDEMLEDESPLEGEVEDPFELLLDGHDVLDTSDEQSAEEAAMHIIKPR